MEPKNTVSNIFSLKDLFSIPLQAVIEANANAAETAIGFIKAYGFEQPASPSAGPDNWGKLKFVSFTYKYNDGGVLKTMTIRIPMLSLIPIPLLEVKNAVFDFGVKIIDYNNSNLNSARRRGNTFYNEFNPAPAQINAMIVPVNKSDSKVSKRQASLTANLDVHIEMVKADLPAGFLQLINLGQQASQGESADRYTITTDTDRLIFREGEPHELSITIEREDEQPMVNEKIITVEIKKNIDFNQDILEQPPRILVGDVIGVPTTTFARVLSINTGIVKLQLLAKGNSLKNNGFIKITSEGAKDLVIYYTNF